MAAKGIQGLGFRVLGLGFRVLGFGFSHVEWRKAVDLATTAALAGQDDGLTWANAFGKEQLWQLWACGGSFGADNPQPTLRSSH